VWDLADFYFYQALGFFVQLAGIIPGVAASFTLLRLTRFNELTAFLAAGVPLLRIATPIILCAVLLSGLVVVDQELIIPNIIPKLMRKYDTMRGSGPTFQIPAMQDASRALLIAGRYHPPTFETPASMDVVDVIERNADLQPMAHIFADHAIWNATDQRWDLENGYRVENLGAEERPTRKTPWRFYHSNINPEEIALFRSGNFVDLLSIHRINQLLDPSRRASYGARDLLRAKHTRVTQWIMNIILLLLSIPAVLTREPQGLRIAAIKCMMLTGACLGLIMICSNLAGQPPPNARWTDLWPALMAWIPVFVFGPLSIYLLDRVKT
jgi:lipopolysaccharide export system permease protein